MAATFGSIGGFEEGEDWPQYVECLTRYFAANGIAKYEKKWSVLLSEIAECIQAAAECYFPCEARREDFPRAGHSYDGAPSLHTLRHCMLQILQPLLKAG